MLAKFAYTPARFSGSRWMLSWRSWASSSTRRGYYEGDFCFQRGACGLAPSRVSRRSCPSWPERWSSWSGRTTRSTATTRPTSRCSWHRCGSALPASWGRSWPMPPWASTRSSVPRSPGPASSTSGSRPAGSARRSPRSSRREPTSAAARRSGLRRSRSRWSRRTRPGRSPSPRRETARSATRSHACSPSPATRSSASTTTTTPAPRWRSSGSRSRRCSAGRSRRRTATAATTWPSSRRGRRPGAGDAGPDRGDPRALPDPLRLLGPAERARAEAAGVPAQGRHV